MAEPTVPGRGPPVNQPATAVLSGTWSVPTLLTPRSISEVRNPLDGMLSRTGRAACRAVACDAGSTVLPDGAGMGAGFAGSAGAGERLAVASPAVPTSTATSPAPSADAASSRREKRRAHGRCREVHRLKVVARTWAHDGGGANSAGWVSGSVVPAASPGSQMAGAGTTMPGDFTACQAGSHQSSGRQVSAGIGPV